MSLEDLIQRAQAGDREAQDRICREYYSSVLGFVKVRMGRLLRSKEESADVAQSVFRQVLASDAFARTPFADPVQFRVWLAQVVDHKVTDHLRALNAKKRGRLETVALECESGESNAGAGAAISDSDRLRPEAMAGAREDFARLRDACDRLPTALHRDVAHLCFLELHGTSEAARRLNLDPRKVRRLRAEALAIVAQALGEGGGPIG